MSRFTRLVGLVATLSLLLCCTGCALETGPDPPDTTSGDASVVLGTHAQWKQQPDDFIQLADGSELPIVLGHQGLWMVVLAVRANDALLPGTVDLWVRMEAAGTELGELQLVERELDAELDGHGYIYDIWYIVSDPSLATYEAILTVEVTHDSGFATTLQHTVFLSGGAI